MECQLTPLVSWLVVIGAGASVLGFLLGAIHATRKAERMIRGGRAPLR